MSSPRRKRVLVVDDEPLLLEVWGRLFEKVDVDCVTANSVSEAIEALDAQDFDLLITDLRMPEADGTVLLAHVRDNVDTPLDVVVCTGYSDDASPEEYSAFNVLRVISKPFRIRQELAYFRARLSE